MFVNVDPMSPYFYSPFTLRLVGCETTELKSEGCCFILKPVWIELLDLLTEEMEHTVALTHKHDSKLVIEFQNDNMDEEHEDNRLR